MTYQNTDADLTTKMINYYNDNDFSNNVILPIVGGSFLGITHALGLNEMQKETLTSPYLSYAIGAVTLFTNTISAKVKDSECKKIIQSIDDIPYSVENLRNKLRKHENGENILKNIRNKKSKKGYKYSAKHLLIDSISFTTFYGIGYSIIKPEIYTSLIDQFIDFLL